MTMDLHTEGRLRRIRRTKRINRTWNTASRAFTGFLFVAVGAAVMYTAGNVFTMIFGAFFFAAGIVGMSRS